MFVKSIKYPNTFDLISGKTELDSYVKSINRCIGLIITTARGELLGDPNFGCKLYEDVFDSITDANIEEFKEDIANAIANYEKRAIVNSIDIKPSPNNDNPEYFGPNVLYVTIEYTVANTSRIATISLAVEEREQNVQ